LEALENLWDLARFHLVIHENNPELTSDYMYTLAQAYKAINKARGV
jgi:hypothetical protein